MQHFVLVWVDANIKESEKDSQKTLAQLRSVVNEVKVLTQLNDCLTFLQKLETEMAFVIISGTLGQDLMPQTHPIAQLNAIFIFCGNQTFHEKWAKEWPKVKGVHTQIKPICEALQLAAKQCDQDSTPISFVEVGESGSNTNLNQLEPSFMYTQLFKKILLDMQHEDQALRDLVTYCRDQFTSNPGELTYNYGI